MLKLAGAIAGIVAEKLVQTFVACELLGDFSRYDFEVLLRTAVFILCGADSTMRTVRIRKLAKVLSGSELDDDSAGSFCR